MLNLSPHCTMGLTLGKVLTIVFFFKKKNIFDITKLWVKSLKILDEKEFIDFLPVPYVFVKVFLIKGNIRSFGKTE